MPRKCIQVLVLIYTAVPNPRISSNDTCINEQFYTSLILRTVRHTMYYTKSRKVLTKPKKHISQLLLTLNWLLIFFMDNFKIILVRHFATIFFYICAKHLIFFNLKIVRSGSRVCFRSKRHSEIFCSPDPCLCNRRLSSSKQPIAHILYY